MADELRREDDERVPDDETLPTGASSGVDRERVARRAHDRYERRGGEHGRDREDWFEAERELIAAQLEEE